MKITIARKALIQLLYKVQGVCPSKSAYDEVLSYCRIRASQNGWIEILGTDLDIVVSNQGTAEVDGEGTLILAAKRLFDTVKSLPEGDLIIESMDNHWATLQTEARPLQIKLAGRHPDDYPQISNLPIDKAFEIPAERLLDMIDKVSFSIDPKSKTPHLIGAFFQVTERQTIQMVSTDSYRLSKVEVKLNIPKDQVDASFYDGIIIPRKALDEIKRIIPPEGDIRLSLDGDELRLEHPSVHLSVRLIPGKFIDFANIIPKQDEIQTRMRTSRDGLMSALRMASNYAPKTKNTTFTIEKNQIEIYTYDNEQGKFWESLPCEAEGPMTRIGFNYQFIIDILRVIEDENVVFELVSPQKAILLTDPSRPDVIFLVMPMRPLNPTD